MRRKSWACRPTRTWIRFPGPVDLAFIIVPVEAVLIGHRTMRPEKGQPGPLSLPPALRKPGLPGKTFQDQLAEKAREYGVRVVGPNCFGVLNCNIGLNASIAVIMPEGGGKISFVVQSGAYGMAVCALARDHHLKVSKIIGLGNKCDIKDDEILRYLGQDPETEVIALYLESIEEESAFFAEAERLSRAQTHRRMQTGEDSRREDGHSVAYGHSPGIFRHPAGGHSENAGMIRGGQWRGNG